MHYMISKLIMSWMIIITLIIYNFNNDKIVFGPSDSLKILNITIDNFYKYFGIIGLCSINSILRSCNHNILQSYITNTIQDTEKKENINKIFTYEIVIVSSTYYWFDFYMYMNILFSQIDFFIAELISDIIVSIYITRYFIEKKKEYIILS